MNPASTGNDLPLRVTLVGPYPPPFGGIASHLVGLVPGLRKRGVEDIAVVSFGATEAVLEQGGATIYRVNARGRAARALLRHPLAIAAAAARLARWRLEPARLLAEAVRAVTIDEVVDRHRSTVVSFYQSNESLSLAALRRTWGRKRGVVLTVFGEVFDDEKFLADRRGPLGDLLSSADRILASSRHCARSFARLGLSHGIEPLYYGVSIPRFSASTAREARQRHGMPPDAIIALFMGRFSPDMGVESILEAAPRLLTRLPALRIILAGARGPLAEAAAQVAARSGGRIAVRHDVTFDEQPDLYAASDIVLAPTRDQHACMGMSIKEAMAAGRAAVGSDAGGIPEAIVPGVTGLLVPLGPDGGVQIDGFVDAIGALATDTSRREAMGVAARARAEDIFSDERTIDRVKEVFHSVAPR